MTYVNDQQIDSAGVADDANVLITISSSEAAGIIRRWGSVLHAIGELSVEALMRGAMDESVVALLREQRPQQYESEREATERIRSVLDAGYRVFVRGTDDPIDSARAGQIPARSLLAHGNPEYQSTSFCVLHLTVEPFGAAASGARRDEVGAVNACDALRHEMAVAAEAEPAAAQAMVAARADETGETAGEETIVRAAAAGVCAEYHCADDLPPRQANDIRESTDQPQVGSRDGDCAEAQEKWLAAAHDAGDEPAPVSAAVAADAAAACEHEEPVAAAEMVRAEPAAAQAQPRKYATKAEALTEQFGPKIAALDLRGLFVGNFGFQRDTVVDVAKLATLSPQTISAYLMKANALRQSGEHEKATSYYRVLLKSDPDNPDYRFLYGKTLMEMGRVQPARECFERARELGHENAAHELEQLEKRKARKPARAFLHFLHRTAPSR